MLLYIGTDQLTPTRGLTWTSNRWRYQRWRQQRQLVLKHMWKHIFTSKRRSIDLLQCLGVWQLDCALWEVLSLTNFFDCPLWTAYLICVKKCLYELITRHWKFVQCWNPSFTLWLEGIEGCKITEHHRYLSFLWDKTRLERSLLCQATSSKLGVLYVLTVKVVLSFA